MDAPEQERERYVEAIGAGHRSQSMASRKSRCNREGCRSRECAFVSVMEERVGMRCDGLAERRSKVGTKASSLRLDDKPSSKVGTRQTLQIDSRREEGMSDVG